MYCSVCGYKDWSSTSVSLLLWDLSRLQRSWCWLFKYGAVYFHHFYEWVKSVILSVIKHSYQFHQFEQSMSVPISSNNCRLLWSTAVIFCHLRYRVLKSLLCASIQHFLGFLLIYYHLVSFECLLCSLFIICISVHLEPSAVTCCLCSWCCTRVWK